MQSPLVPLVQLEQTVQKLGSYRDPKRVATEALNLVHTHFTLQPYTRVAVANGPEVLVFVGTIPCDYKGSRYNIPMNIWLMEGYPARPPVCVVTPTPDMVITKPHLHVSSLGVCFLSYLSNWSPNTSNLILLVAELSKIFSDDPPVRAKPITQTSPTPPQSQGFPQHTMRQQPQQQPQPQPQQPPPQPQPQPQQPQQPLSLLSQGFPQHTMRQQPQQHPQQQQYQYPQTLPYSSSTPTQQQPLSPQQEQLSQQQQSRRQEHLSKGQSTPSFRPHHASLTHTRSESSPTTLDNPTAEAQSDLLRKVLEEKIRQRLGVLHNIQQQIEEKQKLQAELAKLTEQEKEMEQRIKEKEQAANTVDIDKFPDTSATMQRILKYRADDLALDDTQYFIDVALGRELIPLDIALKITRDLSRQQFMARYMLCKLEKDATS